MNLLSLSTKWIQSAMNYSTITTTWKRFLLLPIATFFLTGMGLAQFTGLESEIHATSEHGTTYHIYAHFGSPSDEVLAVYSIGQEEEGSVNLDLEVTTSFFQETTIGVNLGSDLFGTLLAMFPDAAYDSWLTIGSTSNADAQVSSIGMSGAFIDFNTGTGFTLDGAVGGSWYVTPGSNPLAMAGENGKVLLAQLTAADGVDGAGHVICTWNLNWRDAAGVAHYEQELALNTQDFVIDVMGCTDATACNYDETATADDGNCQYIDTCGVCGGDGIAEGACDCEGTTPETGYDCSGDCLADADEDGVCDALDPCVGTIDACGVCNGPGDIYACGCDEIPEGDCDCNGNVLDECGVCGGEGIPEGDCDCNGNQADAAGECGGACDSDTDNDGICDDIDTCVGTLDACDVCNGPGDIYECGCADIPEGDCDCNGNELDALGACGGSCTADEDGRRRRLR